MKTKVLLAAVALSYAPLGVAGNKVEYRTEKVANALLKGRESWREFAACSVIGGSDSTANSYGGD